MRPTSYVSDIVKSADGIVHFWLDHLEVTFSACSDQFMKFAKGYFSDRWSVLFRFNKKSATEYPFFFEVSKSKGYQKMASFKYDFKWTTDQLFEVHFAKPGSKYPSKVIFHWKFFKCCRLDCFDFTVSDLLLFLEENFPNPSVRLFHVCADIKIEKAISQNWFLADLYHEMRCIRFKNDDWASPNPSATKHFNIVGNDTTRTIYDGDDDHKNNKAYFLRIYDKTYEVESRQKNQRYYSDVLSIADKYSIYRFEIEFRPNVAKTISFKTIKNNSDLLDIFLTRLLNSDVPVFKNVNHGKILMKRKKSPKNLLWGDVYKLDLLKRNRDLKTAITYMNKLEQWGVDVLAIRKHLLEEWNPDLGYSRKDEFMLYYRNTLDTISEFLRDGNVRYTDFEKIVTGHIEYLERMLWVDFKYFMNVVNGYINSDLEAFAKGNYKNFVLLAYVFYKRSVPLISEKTLFFLSMLDSAKVIDFGDKHLKKELDRLTKGKSVQFVLKEIDKDGSNQELVMKLLQLVMNDEKYS